MNTNFKVALRPNMKIQLRLRMDLISKIWPNLALVRFEMSGSDASLVSIYRVVQKQGHPISLQFANILKTP